MQTIEALKNYCKTQNICLICTLHQTSSEVLSMIDYLYVLAKGGHNVFWGPTHQLRQYLKDYGIMCSDVNRVPIETLVRLSAEGLPDIRIVKMKYKTEQVVNNWIESSDNNLIDQHINNMNKKIYLQRCYYSISKRNDRNV